MKHIITVGFLFGACSAFATPAFTVIDLNLPIFSRNCGLASNGNVACPNGSTVQLYNYSTGTDSTIPLNLYKAYTNAQGQVAGLPNFGNDPNFFDGTTVGNVQLPFGYSNFVSGVTVSGIDDYGNIVATFGYPQNAMFYNIQSGFAGLLPVPGSYGVNSSYVVVSPNGTIAIGTSDNSIYVFSGGNGLPGGSQSITSPPAAIVSGVSDSGIVVGNAGAAFQASSAGGVAQICPSCTGLTVINPNGVNSSGDIIGDASDFNAGFAFLYSGGQLTDLNTLLSTNLNAILGGTGWFVQSATAINDNGQILATASNSSIQATVLLTPAVATPEPSTFGLVGLGGALAFFAYRRRHARQ